MQGFPLPDWLLVRRGQPLLGRRRQSAQTAGDVSTGLALDLTVDGVLPYINPMRYSYEMPCTPACYRDTCCHVCTPA